MLLLDGQVHHDTHVIPTGNYVIVVGNYVIATPSEPGNYMSADTRRHDWWRVTGWAGTWLMPDYAAAAADYDAIHLTVGGYLTTAGRALVVNDARCLLAGWDPDKTYWLADMLTEGGPPVRWMQDESAFPGWRQAEPEL